MKPNAKLPRKSRPAVDGRQVSDYLATRKLLVLVREDFDELADVPGFWQSGEFKHISLKGDPDRLSLDNVLSRIEHCVRPDRWLKLHAKMRAGHLTLTVFVKRLIITRK